MAQNAPPIIDVLDFQFKLQCRLKVFANEDISEFNSIYSLVAVASKYNLLFVGSNGPYFQVIQLQNLQKYTCKDGEISNYLRRNVPLPSRPQYLSVNCDCKHLCVIVEKDGCSKAVVYDIPSFLQQNISITQEVRLSATPGIKVVEVSWNPTNSAMFAVCKDDGIAGIYSVNASNIKINELPKTTAATCICWSPKGKQIAVGSHDGKITQYSPDLKLAKVINGPPLDGPQFPISLQWISTFQFIAIYKANAADSPCNLLVINCPKGGDVVYINYEDICYSSGIARPHQFYMIFQNTWNILMVASSNSMEVGVLGFEKDLWIQWNLADSARAELPLSTTNQDTLPIGLCLDTSSTNMLPWGESSVPPMPMLLLLSHHGVLCCFHAINLKQSAQVCQAPEILDKTNSALQYFTSSDKSNLPPNKTTSINKTQQNVLPTSQQPPMTTFSFTFNQPQKSVDAMSSGAPSAQTTKSDIIPKQTIVVNPSNSQSAVGNLISNIYNKVQPVQTLSDSKVNIGNNTRTIQNIVPKMPLKSEPVYIPSNNNEDTEIIVVQMIKEECAMLETELKTLLQHGQNIKIDLGTDNDATNLIQNTISLQKFLDEVNDICQTQSAEIIYLKQILLQTWAYYEEARSRFATKNDPTLATLIQIQPLDAVSLRQLDDIRLLFYYLESQLTQANTALDEQWESFQDSCKKKLSLKLPSIETIYQTMVKQSATIQKQVYIMKDISSRIRSKVRISTIPHLISLENNDILEQRLQTLCIETKDSFQIQYQKILDKQKRLTVNKIKELRNLFKKRQIVHVSIKKPHVLNSTTSSNALISAPFSPISNTKLQPQKLNFVQSTPKPGNQRDTNIVKIEKSKKLPVQTEFAGNVININENQGSADLLSTQNKNIFTIVPSKANEISVPVTNTSNINIFGFGETSASAFVPTTQNVFSVKNPLFNINTSSNTSANTLQKSTSSLNFSVPFSTSLTSKPASVSTTLVNTFSTPLSSASINTIAKPTLFITEPPSAAVPTTKFIFSNPLSSISTSSSVTSTSITDTESALTFNFLNLSSTKIENNTASITNDLNTKSNFTSASLPANTNFSKATEPINGGATANSKIVFPYVSTTSTGYTTSSTFSEKTFDAPSDMITNLKLSTIAPTLFTTNATVITSTKFSSNSEAAQANKQVNNTYNTNTSSIFSTMTDLPNIGATISPIQPVPTTTESNIEIIPTSITSSNKTSKNTNNTSITIISPAKPDVTSVEPKLVLLNTTSSNTTAVVPAIPSTTAVISAVPGTIATTTSVISTTIASSATNTPATITATTITTLTTTAPTFISKTTSVSANMKSIISELPASTSIFATTQQSTGSIFSTTTQPTSIFGNQQQTTSSIFGGSQISVTPASTNSIFKNPTMFGTPQSSSLETSSSVSSSTSTTSTIQPCFGTDVSNSITKTCISTTPVCFFNSTNTSTTTPSLVSSATSISQPIMFSSNNTTSIKQSVFGTPSTQASIFGSPNTPEASGNLFGASAIKSTFPEVKTTSNNAFGSAPSTTTNNSSSSFFTSSISTPALFGQATTFASNSIFNTPTSTNTGSIFGGTSTSSTNIFGNSQASSFGTTNSNTPFGSAFGSSSDNRPFNTSNDSFRFAIPPEGNISSNDETFGFNKQTFGTNLSGTDKTSFSFGNFGISTTSSNAFASGFTPNPFNKSSTQEQSKSPFSGTSIFGSPATTSSNVFGGSSPFNKATPAFGGPATFGQQGPTFGQTNFGSNSNTFSGSSQASPFSSSTHSVGQTGFGASPFGSQPSFGSTSPGSFGAPPTFGSSAFGMNSSFNSPNKFSSTPSDTFGSSNQQSSTFASLANQPTLGFGSLAQQSATPTSQSTFSGGSSFSTWR